MRAAAQHTSELFAQADALWRLVASFAERLGFPAPASVSASFKNNGVFEVAIKSEAASQEAALAIGPTPPTPNERGVVSLGSLGFARALHESPMNSILAKAIALAWSAKKGRDDLAFLALVNRELSVFELDAQAMDRLIARRFDPGRTQLHGFVFEATEEEPGQRYAFLFVRPNDGAAFKFALCTPSAAPGAPALGEAGPFVWSVSYGPSAQQLTPISQNADLEARDQEAMEALSALRFLLARSLPNGIVLGAYTPNAPQNAKNGGERQVDNSPLLSSTLNSDTIWRRFFVPFEAERELVCNLPNGRDRLGRVLYFMHGEAECTRIQPNQPNSVAFQKPIARPQNEPQFHPTQSHEPGLRQDELHDHLQLAVMMTEQDVVYGASERYAEQLAKQRQNARPGDLIVVNETCVSRIMSEDLSRIKRTHLKAGGAPIVELDIAQNGPLEMLSNLVGQHKDLLLDKGGIEALGGVIENGVAFIGFQKGALEEEIRLLFAALGLGFEGFFLPMLDRGDLLGALRSKWLVCHPAPIWQDICERHLMGAHGQILTPPLPYGRTATLRFFEALAKATDTHERFVDFILQAEFAANDEDEPATNAIELGYVLDRAELQRLLVCEGPLHVPALVFLEELGFAQRIFFFAPEGKAAEDVVHQLLAEHLQRPDAIRLDCFSQKEELREALSAAKTQLVYSQFTFDTRLMHCGKGAFDLADLEPGIGGARRTIRRLCRRSEWIGPQRLGRYLSVPGWSP